MLNDNIYTQYLNEAWYVTDNKKVPNAFLGSNLRQPYEIENT